MPEIEPTTPAIAPAPSRWRHPLTAVRNAVVDFAVRLLTKPLSDYTLQLPNDMANLKRHIRKGDVVLVEGNERISECIKYLTQSSWSHAALYVGDEPLRRNPSKRAEFGKIYSEDAEHLLVEALVESGVILSPLGKYRDFNIRVCRPYNISGSDTRDAIEEALRHVGFTYDIKNVVDLARYFLPVSLVPRRLRMQALQFGSGLPTSVICSSLIAQCFERVGFPIIPRYAELPSPAGYRRVRWIRPRAEDRSYGVMRRVSPTLVTPRDFDLSPYFEIIKFNVIESLRFDYRKILWAEDEQAEPAAKKQA